MSCVVGMGTPRGLWGLDEATRRARLAAIADAGIDRIVAGDRIRPRRGTGADALVQLAMLASLEPRLELVGAAVLVGLRPPVMTARQIATIAAAAPGRLTVAVGVGDDRRDAEVFGVDPTTRGRRTDRALEIVRRLLAGERVDGDGVFFAFDGVRLGPPVEPPVTVVVGGRSDDALIRAGCLGDGWMARWASPKAFRRGIAHVERIGEPREVRWQHGIHAWVGVGDSPADGRRHVASELERVTGLGMELLDRYTPTGTPDQIADRLAPYVAAGASTIDLYVCGPDPDTEIAALAEVRRLLRQVG